MNARLRRQLKDRRYGSRHKTRRAVLVPLVASGQVTCWRCGRVIRPGEAWDLGHDDVDPTRYRGPEHATCNRRAAALRRATPSRAW